MPNREYTADEFKKALLALKPFAKNHQELLKAHVHAPDFTMTASELAEVMGYENWNAVNLHYGKLAERFCDHFNDSRTTCLTILASDYVSDDDDSQHLRLVLRPELVTAIKELHWFQT